MRISGVLLTVALGLGHGSLARAQAKPITIDRVVAVVNERVILKSELLRRTQGQSIPAAKAIGEMIDELLLVEAAERAYVTVKAAEIDAAVAQIAKQNNLTTQQLAAALAKQGYPMAIYREELRRQLLRMRTISVLLSSKVSISDEMVKAEYKRRAQQPGAKPFDEMKDELRSELHRKELYRQTQIYLKRAREEAYIAVLL